MHYICCYAMASNTVIMIATICKKWGEEETYNRAEDSEPLPAIDKGSYWDIASNLVRPTCQQDS